MPSDQDKRVMNQVFGDEMAHGIELVATPLLFGVAGWLLDRWVGTTPWFALGLAAFAVVGTIIKMWYGYDAEMRQLESRSRWGAGNAAVQAEAADAAPVDLWSQRKGTTA